MPEMLNLTVDKFTFTVASDRLYTPQGVWCLASGNVFRVGLSDYLQQHSGDVAFVEVKPAGTHLAAEAEAAVIETIKTNIELSCPVAGTIVQVNPCMENAPERINQDPYGEGWLFEIEAGDWENDRKRLLEPSAYYDWMKQEAESEAK